jgi:Escherichia/Staphylococcus phage prohead protease
MKIETPENYEARSVQGTVEVRKAGDGKATIRGLAAVYDSLSDNLGGFRERIEPGAFDKTEMSDVRGLFNHDSNYVLGRTKSKTVRLSVDKKGLNYEIDLPDTQTIRDLVLAPIERGDVDQSSFGFIVGGGNDEWVEDDEGRLIRTIHRVAELFDVSPVTFPAYRDTSVGARSAKRFQEERERMVADATAAINDRKQRGKVLDRLMLRS